MRVAILVAALAVGFVRSSCAQPTATTEPLAFGVLNQRSIALTAGSWNPILSHVSRSSGVPLVLRMGKTAVETTEMTVRGDFAFVYTNHLFTPERVRLGYRVIARPDTAGITAQIVTLERSPVRSLRDLAGREVAFPSREAFAGYWLPRDALARAGVEVSPVFAGNQEGAMAQLGAGRVAAAAVNSSVMRDYARREGLSYRVLWTSPTYPDLAVLASPAVPPGTVLAVQRALVAMAGDPDGQKALAAAAAALGLPTVPGFVKTTDAEYEPYRRFYQETLVKE